MFEMKIPLGQSSRPAKAAQWDPVPRALFFLKKKISCMVVPLGDGDKRMLGSLASESSLLGEFQASEKLYLKTK